MPISDRNLKPGTKLVARYKKEEHTAEVVKTEEGLRYRLADDREFKSPSSAGSAITGGACNGWRFWSIAGSEEAKPKKAPKRKATNPGFERLEDGRYWCNACADGFEAPKGVDPKGCPKGHQPGEKPEA
jgi:hypothetical protein